VINRPWWIIPAGFALLALTLAVYSPPQSSGNGPQSHSVVILKGTPAFTRLNPSQYQWSGITAFSASSSSNAPVFESCTFNSDGTIVPSLPLAEAVAQLLDQGYRIQWVGEQVIATK